MNNKIKRVMVSALCLGMLISFASCSSGKKDESNSGTNTGETSFNIVASFYPMHILCMNLVKGIENVTEYSMSDPNMGCIHDHTFTTDDLKKIENADVFVENGLGLEAFNSQIESTYPDTAIIQASHDVDVSSCEGDACGDEDVNAHVWTNIDNYILQVKYVSTELQRLNVENKDQYIANENAYVNQLNTLKSDYAESLTSLQGEGVLVLDETLPWFCEFLKMNYISIETDHEGEGLSAAVINATIKKMNDNNIKAIFVAKDGSDTNAQRIATETGATIYEMNTCMVGTVNADAYLKDMRANFEKVSNI